MMVRRLVTEHGPLLTCGRIDPYALPSQCYSYQNDVDTSPFVASSALDSFSLSLSRPSPTEADGWHFGHSRNKEESFDMPSSPIR